MPLEFAGNSTERTLRFVFSAAEATLCLTHEQELGQPEFLLAMVVLEVDFGKY